MSVIEKLKEILPELTKSERKSAEYIIQNPIDVVRYSSGDAIATMSGSSRASVIRLTQKIGFKGFSEFKYAMAHEMTDYLSEKPDSIVDYYIKALTTMKSNENSQQLKDAAKLIVKAKRIFSYGYAHSRFAARQFEFRMIRNGDHAQSIPVENGLAELMELYDEDALIIIFSISGGNVDNGYMDQLKRIRESKQCKVILVTMTEHTVAEKYSDVTICIPCVSRMCPNVMLDDEAIFYVLIELLIDAVNKLSKDE